MWIFVLLFCKVIMDGGSLGYSPVNTAIVAGNPMMMLCRVHPNKTMHSSMIAVWKFQSIGNTQTEVLFNGYNVPNRETELFIRKDIEEEFNLAKNRSQLRDAGAYQCIKRIQDQQNLRTETIIAQLTILATLCSLQKLIRYVVPMPATEASYTIEGDQLRMWCSVNYSGNLDPVMEWSRNDGSIVDSTVSYSIDSFPLTVTSTSHQSMHFNKYIIFVYLCKTYFKAPIVDSKKEGSSMATNAPDYKDDCKLTVKVLFGPRNVSITPIKSTYYSGDVLHCYASSNPIPKYEWMEVHTGYAVNGPILILHDTMGKRETNTFQCTAGNVVAGEKKTASAKITINFTGTALDSPSSIRLTLFVGSGAVVFGIAITVMGFILWKLIKRKCYNQSKEQGFEERSPSPHDHESVKSDDLQPTQPSPDIGMDQSSTIHQSATEVEMITNFAESNLQYSTLGDRPIVVEPQPYSSLEVTNSDEQSIQRSKKETTKSYYNVEIQPTDSGEHFTQTYTRKGRPHDYYNVKIETDVSERSSNES